MHPDDCHLENLLFNALLLKTNLEITGAAFVPRPLSAVVQREQDAIWSSSALGYCYSLDI